MIEFHLDPHSGVAPYLQIAQQVKRALRLGLLQVGDQLPTVREVIAHFTINPNTVFKAYRELEREGLVSSRPGEQPPGSGHVCAAHPGHRVAHDASGVTRRPAALAGKRLCGGT
jgi:DNA-binding GntR family transcriptional regulator